MDSSIKHVFNINSLPWQMDKIGQFKNIIGPDFTKNSSIKLLRIDVGNKFETHEHKYLQIMYFIKGKGILTIDEDVYEITPGLIAIVKPNQCHSVTNKDDIQMEIIVFESYQVSLDDNPYVDF